MNPPKLALLECSLLVDRTPPAPLINARRTAPHSTAPHRSVASADRLYQLIQPGCVANFFQPKFKDKHLKKLLSVPQAKHFFYECASL